MGVNDSKRPLVSVIVPIYNVETYIEKCVRSIMGQDYANIEIILVDDGTKDNSGAIVDKLAKEDPRITVIHKMNGGVSSARNTGLDTARGEYVIFVDGDDYLEPDCVSYLLSMVLEYDCDIAMNRQHFAVNKPNQTKKDAACLMDACRVCEAIYLGKIGVAVWNKIYKLSYLREHNLRFDTDIWYGEGMLFNIACLQHTKQVAIGDRKIYHQVFNTGSAVRSFKLENNLCGIRSLEIQKSLWKRKDRRLERAWDFHYASFAHQILWGVVNTDTVEENKELYKRCIRSIREKWFLPLTVGITLKRKVYFMAYAVCPVIMAKMVDVRYKRMARRQEKC